MNNERRRLNNMMNYFGWKPKDLATMTGYSVHNVYTNMSRAISSDLMEAVELWESFTKKGSEYTDFSTIEIEKPVYPNKGWFYLTKHLQRCQKHKNQNTRTILGFRV